MNSKQVEAASNELLRREILSRIARGEDIFKYLFFFKWDALLMSYLINTDPVVDAYSIQL
jgi:hypothetical protein